MSQPVMADAQMSMFKVLRPLPNFQSLYQGVDASVPIAFPGTLDPNAGKEGYDANLLQGIPVPLGARVLIQIPIAIATYDPVLHYSYQLMWRTRNQSDVAQAMLNGRQASAYHLRTEGLGRNEIQGDPTAQRFFIPGASDVEIFEQGESALVGGAAVLNVRPQRYVPLIDPPWVPPLSPNGSNATGVWQQGVYQFSSNENCSGPTYAPIWLDAGGDELLILCYKITEGEGTWDFTDPAEDQAFANTYGTNNGGLPLNPNIGIIVSTGVQGS